MASRSVRKTTPRPRATKAKPWSKAEPLTEARERVLKAVDWTRMLYEHQDAKLLGRKNRDKGFVMLLAHLDGADNALHRYSNRAAVSPVGEAQSAAFNVAHAAMTKALDRYDAIKNGSRGMSERAFGHLVDTRQDAMTAANMKLMAAKARDIRQIAGKIDALWRLIMSDARTEADATMATLGGREFRLLKSIRRDAAHLARGRS